MVDFVVGSNRCGCNYRGWIVFGYDGYTIVVVMAFVMKVAWLLWWCL